MTRVPKTITISPFSSFAAHPNSSLSSTTSAESVYFHFNAMCCWNPPLRVSYIADEILKPACECGVASCNCNKNHWLVILQTNGLEFATEQELFNHYIKTLAIVLGSEEEARKKIYLVSCGWRFGFGTEIDKVTKFKLEGCSGVAAILEDYHYHTRNPNSG
ncbi:Multiple organellar rna editing factor 5 protein, partial [Thalictrum thalictroides]